MEKNKYKLFKVESSNIDLCYIGITRNTLPKVKYNMKHKYAYFINGYSSTYLDYFILLEDDAEIDVYLIKNLNTTDRNEANAILRAEIKANASEVVNKQKIPIQSSYKLVHETPLSTVPETLTDIVQNVEELD